MTLKTIRTSKNLSLSALSRELGISTGYLSHLENGVRRVTPQLADKLAEVLDVPREVISDAVQKIEYPNLLSSSWISSIRVHKLPAVKAFRYHAMNLEPPMDWNNKNEVRRQFIRFIFENIQDSLAIELNESDELLTQIIGHCKS